MSELFRAVGLGFSYGRASRPVLSGLTFSIEAGELVSIVGPNGAGKSTLLGILAGLKHAFVGCCEFQGRSVAQWAGREFARQVSFVPQSLRVDFPFTSEQVVLMGRTPYAGGLFESPADWRVVEQSMALTDTLPFRGRDFRSLSGGERQRVVLAAALAQQPRVLLLDEPTTFLDLEHQLATYELLRKLALGGLLVVAVTHDLNLASTFSTRVLALRQGQLLADGPAAEALLPARISEIFGVPAEILVRANGSRWIAYGN